MDGAATASSSVDIVSSSSFNKLAKAKGKVSTINHSLSLVSNNGWLLSAFQAHFSYLMR